MAALPMTNITTTLARNTLGETTNSVRGLCVSSKINQWALHKPADYGAGNDAWTVDSGSPTGYKAPYGVSNDATGHRLGDFRGYDHVALPPRYLNPAGVTASYYMYEPYPLVEASIYKGEMFSTTNNDGFAPIYHNDDAGLLGVGLVLNGSAIGSITAIDRNSGIVYNQIGSGQVDTTITANYYTRLTSGDSWSISNEIEGGAVPFVVTRNAARFSVTSPSVSPSSLVAGTGGCALQSDYTLSFTLTNNTADSYSITLECEIYHASTFVSQGSTTATFSLTANSSTTESVTVPAATLCLDSGATSTDYIIALRGNNAERIIVSGSNATITITSI